MKETFYNRGSEPVPSTPEQLAAGVEADMARTGKLIKDFGLRYERQESEAAWSQE